MIVSPSSKLQLYFTVPILLLHSSCPIRIIKNISDFLKCLRRLNPLNVFKKLHDEQKKQNNLYVRERFLKNNMGLSGNYKHPHQYVPLFLSTTPYQNTALYFGFTPPLKQFDNGCLKPHNNLATTKSLAHHTLVIDVAHRILQGRAGVTVSKAFR